MQLENMRACIGSTILPLIIAKFSHKQQYFRPYCVFTIFFRTCSNMNNHTQYNRLSFTNRGRVYTANTEYAGYCRAVANTFERVDLDSRTANTKPVDNRRAVA